MENLFIFLSTLTLVKMRDDVTGYLASSAGGHHLGTDAQAAADFLNVIDAELQARSGSTPTEY